jgi:phenylpropionate dioxygenase-like ring-hydroxylating dioxygenase large terminal subunit
MSNVADAKSKTVKITLNDGVERSIKFTLNALAELEDMFGSVQAAFDKLEKENSMKALRAILWAGFLHEDASLTEQQVGNLIDLAYMQELVASLNTAFENDMAQGEVQGQTAIQGTEAPNA